MEEAFYEGQIWGKLTLGKKYKGKNGKATTAWRYVCECGKKGVTTENKIIAGHRSCGCIKKAWHKSVVGKKFGKLTALKQTEERFIDGSKYWICRCECGNKCLVKRSDFFNRKKCSYCHIKLNEVDLTNKVFDNFIVLEKLPNKKDSTYKCECIICSKIIERAYYVILCSGVKSCGCHIKRKVITSDERWNSKLNKQYCEYRKSAIKRKYTFDLTKEEFSILLRSNCYYCNQEPDKKYEHKDGTEFSYGGIDRKDSSIGYNTENCVPCCWKCNYMKKQSSIKEFYEQVKAIYLFLGAKIDEAN